MTALKKALCTFGGLLWLVKCLCFSHVQNFCTWQPSVGPCRNLFGFLVLVLDWVLSWFSEYFSYSVICCNVVNEWLLFDMTTFSQTSFESDHVYSMGGSFPNGHEHHKSNLLQDWSAACGSAVCKHASSRSVLGDLALDSIALYSTRYWSACKSPAGKSMEKPSWKWLPVILTRHGCNRISGLVPEA